MQPLITIPRLNLSAISQYSPQQAQYAQRSNPLTNLEQKIFAIAAANKQNPSSRDLLRLYSQAQPILLKNLRFQSAGLPGYEVLLKVQEIIDCIKTLGKPVPLELHEIKERCELLPGCSVASFRERRKEVAKLICEHQVDMQVLAVSKSRFDAIKNRTEKRAKDILERLKVLKEDLRPEIALANHLRGTAKCIGTDILTIISRQSGSFLCKPSPLTTAAASFRDSNLEGTRTPWNRTGATIQTVSSDSN